MGSATGDTSGRLAKAARFLAAAELLVQNGHLDAAPGRAYYAAYHATIELLMLGGVEAPQAGRWSHGFVQTQLRILAEDQAAARRLRRLYQERLVDDYTMADINVTRAEATVETARAIIAGVVARSRQAP